MVIVTMMVKKFMCHLYTSLASGKEKEEDYYQECFLLTQEMYCQFVHHGDKYQYDFSVYIHIYVLLFSSRRKISKVPSD